MFARRAAIRLASALVWLCLLALCSLTLAQGSATPIQIGQNAIGTLTADASSAQYALSANGGESVTVQVLAITAGFVASFTVTDPAGVQLLSVANPTSLTSISGSASLDDAGVYTIEVAGANGTLGQFLLSVQAGAPLPPPVDLTPDQPISDTVGSATPVHVYRFSTSSAAPSILTILSGSPGAGPLISLYDEDASRTIATNDAGISGIAYRLPPGDKHYHVEVRANDSAGDTAFTICLGDCGGGLLPAQAIAQPQTVVVTPTVSAAEAACTVASGTGGSVNVRSGPGTQYAIVGALPGGQSAPVLGQYTGGGWYEISFSGGVGWAAGSVTKLDGDCTALTSVAAPLNVPLAPTLPPPTSVPSGGGAPPPTSPSGGTPSPTPTLMPTAVPTTASVDATLPDLVAQIVSADYQSEAGVNSVEVTYTVSNVGAPDDNPNHLFNTTVCVSTTCEPGYRITGNTGLKYAVAVPFDAPPQALSVTVTLTVDPDHEVAESNESNNVASYTLVLHSPSGTIHR